MWRILFFQYKRLLYAVQLHKINGSVIMDPFNGDIVSMVEVLIMILVILMSDSGIQTTRIFNKPFIYAHLKQKILPNT